MILAFLWGVWGCLCWLASLLKAAGGLCWLCKVGVGCAAWAVRGMRASREVREVAEVRAGGGR
jgi:hypothetical protein